jgi:phosphoribosylamine--glycine ligase
MKVMVVGAGGREHTLVWKIAQSSHVEKVYCAPGNGGIQQCRSSGGAAESIPLKAEDIEGLLKAAGEKGVDLTVVGPEAPLTKGITDIFEDNGLKIFGPSRAGSQLEGSKAFAKDLMKKYGIPTGEFQTFLSPEDARAYIKAKGAPLVVKADGLAAGKGVLLCQAMEEAEEAVAEIMEKRAFGEAGNKVVIEEFLTGEEASFIAFTDGETVLPMASSQDHKAIYDDDKGPNTGGMGAYSPAPVVSDELFDKIMNEIMIPTVRAMRKEGIIYKGVLYAGLMIKEGQPKVLEFNCRFGDPETQPLLFRMKSDLVEVLKAVVDGKLSGKEIEWDPTPAVCVVMASKGYPGKYEKGFEIKGIEEANALPDTYVFHAGTAIKDGKVVTSGGRVLGVTARGAGIKDAIKAAYRAVEKIKWDGAYYRRDIGQKGLEKFEIY